ncbi:MAG: hypothetical protein H7068_04245 [Pedobacter sp.]|nr:hypothetical protein [Chitinophagaceae bacterium]
MIEAHTEYLTTLDFKLFMFNNDIPLSVITNKNNESLDKAIKYWRRHELLPFFPEGKHFAYINLTKLTWLRILETLRGFNYTVENTKKVCDYFFKDAYFDDLPRKNLVDNREILIAKKTAKPLNEEEAFLLDKIDEVLADEKLLYLMKFDINYLSNLISIVLDSNEEAGLLIFLDGSVVEFAQGKYFNHHTTNKDISEPHIYLSLTYFLKEFISNSEIEKFIMPSILNDNEKMVLKELRSENVQEINIKKSSNDHIRIETTRGGTISGEQALKIKQILGLSNYQEIKISTRDDKTLSFKKTNKRI